MVVVVVVSIVVVVVVSIAIGLAVVLSSSFSFVLQTICANLPCLPFCLHRPSRLLKQSSPLTIFPILVIPSSLQACLHSVFFTIVDPGGHFTLAFAKMYFVLAFFGATIIRPNIGGAYSH